MRGYIQQHELSYTNSFRFSVSGEDITTPGFEWIKTGEEFSFNGSMYDVVSVTRSHGNVFIRAINDSQEENIMATIRKHHSHSSTPAAMALLSAVFTPPVYNWQIVSASPSNPSYNIFPAPGTATISLPVPIPPPDLM